MRVLYPCYSRQWLTVIIAPQVGSTAVLTRTGSWLPPLEKCYRICRSKDGDIGSPDTMSTDLYIPIDIAYSYSCLLTLIYTLSASTPGLLAVAPPVRLG